VFCGKESFLSFERHAHFVQRVFLDLANAFRRNLIFTGQFVQCGFIFVQPAALDDVLTACIQCF